MSSDYLILSGSIGRGHDSVAEACADAFARAGKSSQTRDCMALLGGLASRTAHLLYRSMFALPPIYDAWHFSGLRADARLIAASGTRASERVHAALREELEDPSLEAAIAVFATGAGAIARAKHARPDLGAFVVVVDATAHSLWFARGIDRYITFSELSAATVRQYDPEADVAVIDPPVRPGFRCALNRIEARGQLGLALERPMVLVMGGSWAVGPLDAVARRLTGRDTKVVVLLGNNHRLVRQHRRTPELESPEPSFLPFSDDVPRLMAAADVVVTSPGQACHEARAVGRPIVLLDVVPGHGRENLLAELARGGAVAATARPETIERAVVQAMSSLRSTGTHQDQPWHEQFLKAVGY